MKKLNWLILHIMLGSLILGGCAGTCPVLIRVADPTPVFPDEYHAVITFFGPFTQGPGLEFEIWDGDKLIGCAAKKTYFQCKITPGEHLFLARAENWAYLKADLEAGKFYYVSARNFPGGISPRVALNPISKGEVSQEQINAWIQQRSVSGLNQEMLEDYQKKMAGEVKKAITKFKAGRIRGHGILVKEDGRI